MTIAIRHGDCRNILPTLPDASVHCVVTSPPYWGLRDYGTATWQGGNPGCGHEPSQAWLDSQFNANSAFGNGAGTQSAAGKKRWYVNGACRDCGATRIDAQLGLEPDFNAYVGAMVGVFREVRRVLRDDGTLWLNLGDSYAGSWSGNSMRPNGGTQRPGSPGFQPLTDDRYVGRNGNTSGLKPKDLCGIPWRVAFALQADGWYLRQDIIWSKPNPMPESVTDRCTKAHEYLFLLSKRERYFYDAEAIKERVGEETRRQKSFRGGCYTNNTAFNNSHDYSGHEPYSDGEPSLDGRNKRSVWEVTTAPFSEAHFATFPPALIEPCIKAGTSERGCCGQCGRPWVRQVEIEQVKLTGSTGSAHVPGAQNWVGVTDRTRKQVSTLGWLPSCACAAEVVPCTVLDPFGGAGTTGLVADRLQRNAILIELNPAYAAMATNRVVGDAPLFVEVQPESE